MRTAINGWIRCYRQPPSEFKLKQPRNKEEHDNSDANDDDDYDCHHRTGRVYCVVVGQEWIQQNRACCGCDTCLK